MNIQQIDTIQDGGIILIWDGETRATNNSKTNSFKTLNHLLNKELCLHKLLMFNLYPHQL